MLCPRTPKKHGLEEEVGYSMWAATAQSPEQGRRRRKTKEVTATLKAEQQQRGHL